MFCAETQDSLVVTHSFLYHGTSAEVVEGVEEDVKCTPLLFKEDFLSEQYFGENQPTSILTEQVHFGEGMHRRAFRTKLLGGMLPVFSPGHPCVLKVHNAISQGTKNNEELVRKNYSLAVEVGGIYKQWFRHGLCTESAELRRGKVSGCIAKLLMVLIPYKITRTWEGNNMLYLHAVCCHQ